MITDTAPELERTSGSDPAPPAPLVVEHLTHHFERVVALEDVSLTLSCGHVHALVGPSGAGKTTLLQVAGGIIVPSHGEVRLFGEDPRARDPFSRGAVVVPADGVSFDPLTVRATITSWRALYGSPLSVDATLSQLGLRDLASRDVSGLAAGETRRVLLAMAFVTNRPLVVLDEPTTGLDPQGRRDLWSAIRAVAREGRTVLVSTCQLADAERFADRVHVLHGGRLLASGAVASVLERWEPVERITFRTSIDDDSEIARVIGAGRPIALSAVDGVEPRWAVEVDSGRSADVVRTLLDDDRFAEFTVDRAGLESVFDRLVNGRGDRRVVGGDDRSAVTPGRRRGSRRLVIDRRQLLDEPERNVRAPASNGETYRYHACDHGELYGAERATADPTT